ncbi:MAG TPA: ABC transporter permease [Vicinamibacterales bacterium]|nr:ABC transporter permease [Vicinamibacterales bacterium]
MRFYRLLLRLYPASFRAEYGDEMCAVFAARRREVNPIALWADAITDVIINAVRVHLSLLQDDLRWAARVLWKSPGFTLTAVLVASLGMGATTAAFTLVDHVLLRPLPFPHPEQLVTLNEIERDGSFEPATPPGFDDWRAMNTSFSSVGAYIGASLPMNLSGGGEPLRPNVIVASADVFKTLEIGPVAGRPLTADDDRDDSSPVALLSTPLANALFGNPTAAIGRTIRLDGRPRDIVGVMPATFVFPFRDADVWIPRRTWGSSRSNHMLGVVARLRPGVSLDQARADMNVVAAQLERAYPKENAGVGIGIQRIRDRMSPRTRMLPLAVLGAAFCLTLIGCTNLASLLFARATGRRQEMAVRVAVGASRERIARQLLTESFVLAITGGVIGLLLAVVVTPWLTRMVPEGLPIGAVPEIDWRVFAFAGALTLVTTIAFGVGPALRLSRGVDLSWLRTRSADGGRSTRLRAALVLSEVIGTVVLLVAAGLLLKAMWRVQAVDTGFRPEGVLTLKTVLPISAPAASRQTFYSRVLADARALPGVTSAAYITFVPMTFASGNFVVTVPGALTEAQAHTRFVTPDFFQTLGIPMLRGRDLDERDDQPTSPPVVVIGRSLADRLWPLQDAIGQTMTLAEVDWQVVGVVGDVAVHGLEQVAIPQAYFPASKVPPGLSFYAPKDLVVRTSGSPIALAPALRRIVHAIDPEQSVSDVRTLEDVVGAQTASRRVQFTVLAAFAAVAVLLAAVGIYGLLSFAVSMRTREVGVRMALGAGRRDVLTMFLRQGIVLGSAGIIIGAPLAYAAGRGMTSLLFGVTPGDPVIYGAAALLAILMTLGGSVRPAFRAASVDPVIAIQSE